MKTKLTYYFIGLVCGTILGIVLYDLHVTLKAEEIEVHHPIQKEVKPESVTKHYDSLNMKPLKELYETIDRIEEHREEFDRTMEELENKH